MMQTRGSVRFLGSAVAHQTLPGSVMAQLEAQNMT